MNWMTITGYILMCIGLGISFTGWSKLVSDKYQTPKGQYVLTVDIGTEVGMAKVTGATFEKEGTQLLYAIPPKTDTKKSE